MTVRLAEQSISLTSVAYSFDNFIIDLAAFIFFANSLFHIVIHPIQKQSLILKLMKMLYAVRAYDCDG